MKVSKSLIVVLSILPLMSVFAVFADEAKDDTTDEAGYLQSLSVLDSADSAQSEASDFIKALGKKYDSELQRVQSEITSLKQLEQLMRKWFILISVALFALILLQHLLSIRSDKKYQRELKRLEADLKRCKSINDKLFFIISHDLKSQVSVVIGAADLLCGAEIEFHAEERDKFIRMMRQSSRHLQNLLQNIVEWSRLESGKVKCHPERLNLARVAADTIASFRILADKKQINLGANIPEKMEVYGDRKLTESTLRNLISNAVKFTDTGGEVIITAEKKDQYIEVSVKDSGIGIAKENLPNIFNLETQHRNLGTANERGTGLGLILCREFVRENGGEIRVESESGKGSVFSFTLPAVETETGKSRL